MPDYLGGIHNDLVTQIADAGTVNAVYGQGYGRVSQRFMPEAGAEAADTYFQHDLYGSTLFAADAQGVIRHHAAHDIWGVPKTICADGGIASGLRFTTYDYDSVLGKHFAHARMYDPSLGRMLGADPVKRGLNGYTYCDNDPVNQTDPTGEVANILLGGIAGGIIGGAFGFAGSALSQIAGGKGFSARKAWGAAANGAIVGAARGALVGSGAGIPLAFGVDFAAGMAGSLAEQRIAGERISPVRAAVDGAFNAAGGRLYGTSPLRNAKNAFIRGALEGAVKGGAYNIADVLDNRLRNAYGSGSRRNPGTRTPWNKDNRSPWNSRTPRPIGSRCPQSDCIRPKPLKGMRNPKRRGSGNNSRNNAHRNDRFSLGSFVRDVVSGAVMGGLASVAFYGAGKAVEALKQGVQKKNRKLLTHDRKGLYSIGNTGHKVNDYTKEEILALIDGKTRQSTKVARAIRRGEIGLNLLSDRLFEDYFGVNKLVVGIEVKNQIYIRNKADHILSTIVHEGTHALDYKSGYGIDGVSHWAWEKRAYFYERQFQLALGEQVNFTTINDMLVHIWSNYENEIYNPYN
ncbi:MAG: RHS repeat-associated core domain-containing protein [Lachnospiraceae bacterium]|nr:RHS repeat-associated core domain-containing protein [Lachnospiraceae bacterium]